MFLDPEDGGISRTLAKRGIREPCFMWILEKEACGSIGIDVGANIGYTTLHLCRNMKRVVAIEPDPRSRKLLIENINANGFEERVDICNFAVSDMEGRTSIYLADKPNLSSLHRRPGISEQRHEVLTKTIDSLNLQPNFIKMDIEGHEVQALNGAMGSLEATKQCKILIEVHPQFYSGDSFERVLKKLVAMDFAIKYVVSAGVAQPDLFRANGYEPLWKSAKNKRGVYDCLSTEDAIKWSSYPIEQVCPKGKVSPKIIRSILLVKQ